MERMGTGAAGRGGRGGLPTPGEVLLLLLVTAMGYVFFGVLFQVLFGEVGILLTQLLVILLPGLLWAKVRGHDLVRTFSLRRPSSRGVLGGFLLLAGGLPLAWLLSWLQSFFIEVPVELLEGLSAFLTTDDPLRMLWLLLLVAVTPAICEEFLFRGYLLSGFRSRWSVPVSIILSGVVFGVFHLSPETAFRFLPTAWLGILLAWVVVETRSIWTGVLLHFLNNGTILLLTLLPATREVATDVDQSPPWLLLPLAVVIFVVGVRVLQKEGRRLRGEVEEEEP